jgi:6-phosphogluconolactonase
MRHEKSFATPAALADALAVHLAGRLRHDIASRGRASLILSGGRSPAPMFEALAATDLKWGKVDVTLADERLVPADHPASNASLVGRHLLQGNAAAANFVPLWKGTGDPAKAAQEALAHLARPFTAIVLGLGEDGHFASLFPGVPGLADALDPAHAAVAVEVPAGQGRDARVSLTLPTLTDAAEIILAFSGAAKRAVFERARADGPVEELPVRAILRQGRAPVDVYWSP